MPSASSKLKSVYSPPPSANAKAVFVVVPGIERHDPLQWNAVENHESWLCSPELRTDGEVAVFNYAHNLSSHDLSVGKINEEGAKLFSELEQLPTYETCPIVLISHGSGGFILKKAISIAYRKQRSLHTHIAAAVLISVPHTKRESSAEWVKTLSLVINKTWRARTSPTLSELAAVLIEDCRHFELAFSDVPIATLFERVGTRTGFTTKTLIVDKDRARTNLYREICLGVNQDHCSSCRIDFDVQSKLFKFLQTSVAARALDPRPEEPPFSLEHSTVTSQSGDDVLLPDDPQSVFQQDQPPNAIPESGHLRPEGPGSETPILAARSLGSQRLVPDFTELRIKDTKFPYFMVPYERNENFYGREPILAKIASTLCPQSTERDASFASFALSGQGGIGKSQVAVEFVHRHRSDFEAIFWVPGNDVEKLHQTFRDIAIGLGLVTLDSADSFDKSLTRNAVLGWLEHPLKSHQHNGERGSDEATWLMVFDNVDDPEALHDFWPRSASGNVLLTTRDPYAGSNFSVCKKGEPLPEFDREDTVKFLVRLTSRDGDEEDSRLAIDFAARLGGIPLAIVTMAGYIHRREITFAEFLRVYEDHHSHQTLFTTKVGHQLANGYEQTIASAYRFEDLVHSNDLLDVLCFLDPDLIAEYILTDNNVETDIGAFPLSQDDYFSARTELLKSSLITRNRTNKTLTIHRLTQDTRRSNMSPKRYSAVFASVLQLLAGVWPYGVEFGFLGYENYGWQRGNELYTHILFLRRLSNNVIHPAGFTEAHLRSSQVLLEAAWFSIMRADYADTKFLVEMAEMMLQPLELDVQGQLRQPQIVRGRFEEQKRLLHFYRGCRALHTNEPRESLHHLQTFRNLLRDEVGEEPSGHDQRMGVAWNELGNAHLQNDDKDNAEACFRKSVSFLTVVDGVKPNTVSMPLINLGFVLWLKHQLTEAAETFQMALEYREANYGPSDTVSFAMGKLYLGYGNVKKDQDDLDASFDFHNKCLRQYKQSLGPFHHRVGDGSVRLSDHYVRTSRLQEAKTLLDQACKIYGGRPHFRPEEARAVYKLSGVLRMLGQSDEADKEAQRALKLFRQVHPNDERGLEDLTVLDFDRPIMFWSK